MKKLWAALAAVSLLLSFSACGKSEVRALDAAPRMSQEEPLEGLDWESAYAAHRPEEIVFTVGSETVTWQEFFYQLVYCTRALESSSGVTVTDWAMEMTGEDGESLPVGEYVLQRAVSLLKEYHVVHEQLSARGIILSEEGHARVEAYRQTTIKESFAGDEAAFQRWLEAMYCSEEIWQWICQTDELYNDGFEALYGPGGSALTEEEVLSYGRDYGYVAIRPIYIYNNANPSADSAEPSDSDPMSLMLSELSAHKDEPAALELCFEALYEQYNENLSLENYPEGRCVWRGDVEDALYEAALGMTDYEYAIVSLVEADVLLLRRPMEPDMDVFFDAENETMYSLRHYAAWQAYTDLIHGPGGWMETAIVQPEEPFEDFSLEDIF